MRDLLFADDFFDGDLSVVATWKSLVTGERHDIPVLWVNDPFSARPEHEGSKPAVKVHDSFARTMRQDDQLTIEGTRYRVPYMEPFDSEGFARAELMDDDPY